ncbi:uncharacterized protein LOC124282569 [Haliotis rubra]|uniref:uncharacterized protein LOC124282569 n=1 Tax=Haliotis rubra TaxID=36100 RepID=UPI001EE6130D|nr:uncharacterized protein LOC124282569 [Haliotis rubra]
MGKELKRIGFAEIKHYPPVAEADMARLYDYVCSSDSPLLLQYKVFVEIMLHFGRRGRENLSVLRISDLAVTTDADGDMYVYMTRDEQTKNHQEDGGRAQGRMYEKKDDPRCPVRTFIKYIRRLNKDCPKLFQQPNSEMENGNLYHGVPLGHNRLGSMMATLSTKAGLSQKYTNHSLRATTVHVLDSAQVPSRHIMTVTGHKAETSLKTYTGFTDDKTKKMMSTAISDMTCAQLIREKENSLPILGDHDLTNCLTDCEIDEILKTLPVPESSVSVSDNNMHVLNHSMTNRLMFQMPGPVINNCNVTINYNFNSKQ